MAPSAYQEHHSTSLHISNETTIIQHHCRHEASKLPSSLPSIPTPALSPLTARARGHKIVLPASVSTTASQSQRFFSTPIDKCEEAATVTHQQHQSASFISTTSSISPESSDSTALSCSSTSITTASFSPSMLSSFSRAPTVAATSIVAEEGTSKPPAPSLVISQPHSFESGSSVVETDTVPALPNVPSDVVQHCLLFPTYATRHSRSGSKDPNDWNVRVRGWAFSKRSNRRKRLVMSMARKIAGVTKDSNQQVYETLESRFGMFLASNTHGAQFSIQCVGSVHGASGISSSSASSAMTSPYLTHMELTGDSGTDYPAVDILLHELESEQNEDQDMLLTAEPDEDDADKREHENDKDPMAKVMQSNAIYNEYEASIQRSAMIGSKSFAEHVKYALEAERAHQQENGNISAKVRPSETKQDVQDTLANLSRSGSKEDEASSTTTVASSFSEKVSKGAAALFKGAIQRYRRPSVMGDVSSNNSVDSLKLLPVSQPSTRTSSNISDMSVSLDENAECENVSSGLPNPNRNDSGDSDITTTHEDLGHGSFPTVRISSRPGGHFDGTLRASHSLESESWNQPARQERHGRFLKLQAYHPEMHETCNGVVNLIEPEGISVISDIDDTIKETNVTAGARTILRNTFLKEMRQVDGMSETYQKWWNRGAAVHYVSNSPWQLIPSLMDFFHTHKFPPGSAHLRLHDSVLKTYFMSAPGENKRRCIREILTDFPHRKFILVGDSGEIDMEIYTEMALAFPNQIFRIFIRDITTPRLRELMMARPPSPPPQAPLEFQVSRSRSFSSMLLPKTPINSVMTSGLGSLFSRRGSTASTVESPVPKSASPNRPADEEIVKSEPLNVETNSSDSDSHDHQHPSVGSFEPSGPIQEQTVSPNTSGASRHIVSGVRAITNSILVSTIRQSVSLSPSSPKLSPKASPRLSPRLSTKNGWIQGVVGAKSGNASPRSPMVENTATLAAYPFPTVEDNVTALAATSLSKTPSCLSLSSPEFVEEKDSKNILVTPESMMPAHEKDIFEGFVAIEQQQQQHSAAMTSSVTTAPRSRTETWSSSESTSIQLLTAMEPTRPSQGPIPSSGMMMASRQAKSTTNLASSHSSGGNHINSFSMTTKGPMEVWQERVEKCQRQLSEGMLTLFESANELQDCLIVDEMFRRYS